MTKFINRMTERPFLTCIIILPACVVVGELLDAVL